MSNEIRHTENEPVKLYTSLHDLPLANFIDVAIDGNLDALIKAGQPTPEQLAETWDDLQEQFSEVIGSTSTDKRKNLLKEGTRIKIKLFEIETCVAILSRAYVPRFAERLNKALQHNFKFNVDDPEAYEKDLKSALLRAKSLKIEATLNEMGLQALIAENSNGNNPGFTREFFSDLLIVLSDNAGYEINEQISTYKFCKRINLLKKSTAENNSKKSIKAKI